MIQSHSQQTQGLRSYLGSCHRHPAWILELACLFGEKYPFQEEERQQQDKRIEAETGAVILANIQQNPGSRDEQAVPKHEKDRAILKTV